MDKRIGLINKAELARRLGVSKELVSRWFRSKPPAVPDHWRKKVAKETGMPEDAIP